MSAMPVTNEKIYGDWRFTPAWLFATVVIVTVYAVLPLRGVLWSHVMVLVGASQENAPMIDGEA